MSFKQKSKILVVNKCEADLDCYFADGNNQFDMNYE